MQCSTLNPHLFGCFSDYFFFFIFVLILHWFPESDGVSQANVSLFICRVRSSKHFLGAQLTCSLLFFALPSEMRFVSNFHLTPCATLSAICKRRATLTRWICVCAWYYSVQCMACVAHSAQVTYPHNGCLVEMPGNVAHFPLSAASWMRLLFIGFVGPHFLH